MWGVFGDGEMDEPESIAALTLAAREGLDNLTWIINCNLQRLDGPVRGNGQIIQELEALFNGAGWNVVKVLWGSEWDVLFARDKNHALLRNFAATVDGQYQTLGANDGAYNSGAFLRPRPGLARTRVEHVAGGDRRLAPRRPRLAQTLRGAGRGARARGRPTVILAKTKKGYGMGGAGESRMTAHQQKKLDLDALRQMRDRFDLPLTDGDLEAMRFYRPADGQPRDALSARTAGGARRVLARAPRAFGKRGRAGAARRCAQVRARRPTARRCRRRWPSCACFSALLRDKELGPAHGADRRRRSAHVRHGQLFRQVGIYSPAGQLYEPEDAGSMLFYREADDGQLLEEGITEAGALSSWIAAATSYSVHGLPMLPFYIFYSMFGFQRVGDLIWAAADQRSRGFLIGATAGRTTLGGEGLQHQDGSSHVVAATVPNCRAYDPAFAYEVAVIVDHGARADDDGGEDEFYYLTVMNENYAQPSMPAGAYDDIIKGMHRVRGHGRRRRATRRVRLLGSGAILPEVLAAADLLAAEWGVDAEVWSVTSFSELARDARACERWNMLHPRRAGADSHVERAAWPGDAPIDRRHRLRARLPAARSRPIVRGALRRCWAPTGSAAATRARNCGVFSRSTGTPSPSPPCTGSRSAAQLPSTA